MKNYFLLSFMILLGFGSTGSKAQTKYSKSSGTITFFSTAPIEDIKATNTSFTTDFDIEKGTISFTVPIAGFVFRKALMQQHFNELYMESEKFPNASFTGRFEQPHLTFPLAGSSVSKRITGNLTIKRITREMSAEVLMGKTGEEITGLCKFNVKLADYEIKIPRMFVKNIAEVIEVTLDISYKKDDKK